MKQKLLLIVRAFVALLHTDSDNVSQIAALKAQVAELTQEVSLNPDETAEVQGALNQIGAADAPTAVEVKPVADVAPAADPQAVVAATEAIPADVTEAAAAAPSAS